MNKRLVIKTSLICVGIFIILASIAIFYVSLKYDLDIENRYSVLVASKDIAVGDILTEANVGFKVIKESTLTPNMLTDPSLCLGTKALFLIKGGDYLMSYTLLSPEYWNESDDKIIVLPMNVEERLANRIQKGSLIDIRVLPENQKTLPKTVLSHITVEDVLDENGMALGETLGNRKAFAVVTLNEKQRERLYAAQQVGKIIYEHYCDSTQPNASENFVIPSEFYMVPPIIPVNPSIPANEPYKTGAAENTEKNQEDTN